MSALVSTTPLRQVTTVKEMLANKNAAEQLASVAARHLSPEQMLRTVALSVSRTPKLGECTPLSILGALMQAGSLGLIPNTVMGHAYLVPFDRYERGKTKGEKPRKVATEAQLVIGYRGFVQLGWNSDQVATFDAACHYESDPVWKWKRGSNAVLDHETGDETGKILHAYAIFEAKGGGKTWVVWPEAKLVAHRDRYSKGYASDIKYGKKPTDANVNIWLGDPDLARRKTMIRQIAKVMPMSTDIPRAAAYDGARADYAAFALEPAMGSAQIEHVDGDALIDEGGEGIEVDVVEEKPAAEAPKQDEAVPGPDGAAALSAAREKAKAAATAQKPPAEAKPAPAEDKPAEVEQPEPAWLRGFWNDLSLWPRDEAAIDELKALYESNFATIKGTKLYSELHLALRKHAAGADEAPASDESEED